MAYPDGFPVTIDGVTFVENDVFGPDGYEYVTGLPNLISKVATVAGRMDTQETTATTAATNAATSETNAATSEANAATSAAAAIAAAISTDFPVGSTAGTGGAYTVDFDPNRIVGDNFVARINFHTINTDYPTLAIDSNTVYEIVDGDSIDKDGNYARIIAGRIKSGMSLIILFDSSINKYVARGLGAFITPTESGVIQGIPLPSDYAVMYFTFAAQLLEVDYITAEGGGDIELYISPDRTSASGTLITGSNLTLSAATLANADLTANNVIARGQYVVAKVASGYTGRDTIISIPYVQRGL